VVLALSFFFADMDGRAVRAEMKKSGADGYAFSEHGGWMADIINVSLCVGLLRTYHPNFISFKSWAMVVVISICVGIWWRREVSKDIPSAYFHNKRTTVAGWIHLAVAGMLWSMVFVFFDQPITSTSPAATIVVSAALVLSFWLEGLRYKDEEFRQQSPKGFLLRCGSVAIIAFIQMLRNV
jgi:hypothetical protein